VNNIIIKFASYFVIYSITTVITLLVGTKGQAFVKPTTANFFAPLFLFILFTVLFFIYKLFRNKINANSNKIVLSILTIGLISLVLFFTSMIGRNWFARVAFFGIWIGLNLGSMVIINKKLTNEK
jgi:hypothetical protein